MLTISQPYIGSVGHKRMEQDLGSGSMHAATIASRGPSLTLEYGGSVTLSCIRRVAAAEGQSQMLFGT
jgi:hypothetical protein